MNHPTTLLKRIADKDFALVIGFGFHEHNLLKGFEPESLPFRFTRKESSFHAYQLLLRQVQGGEKLPVAIICNYDSVRKERFLLLRNLKRNPLLRAIPLIAVGSSFNERRTEALVNGFDDYFVHPIPWNDLHQRIQFFRQYKRLLADTKLESLERHSFTGGLLKRLFDVVVAASMIAVLSPLLLLIAAAVKITSRGPAVYRSKRVGTGYHVFDFLKFRSMYLDADQRLEHLLHLNQYAPDSDSVFLKIHKDPRVTPLGRFLRKTSLDELPQLLNILKGDMSLVGNRPLPLYEAEQLTRDQWAERFLAPAGLTGLWQTTRRGKSKMSTEERIQLDIEYARRYSLQLDLHILLNTIPAILQEEDV